MMLVYVDFLVAPESLPLVLDELSSERRQVRALAGNLAFDFAADPADAGRVRLLHEWERKEDFRQYRQSEIFKSTGKRLFPLMVEPPRSRLFKPAPTEV